MNAVFETVDKPFRMVDKENQLILLGLDFRDSRNQLGATLLSQSDTVNYPVSYKHINIPSNKK